MGSDEVYRVFEIRPRPTNKIPLYRPFRYVLGDMHGNMQGDFRSYPTEILGGAIGRDDFLRTILQYKVDEWKEELETLVNIAQSQPQAAYAAYTHGVMSKWNYIFRIMDFQEPPTADILQPLESKI